MKQASTLLFLVGRFFSVTQSKGTVLVPVGKQEVYSDITCRYNDPHGRPVDTWTVNQCRYMARKHRREKQSHCAPWMWFLN